MIAVTLLFFRQFLMEILTEGVRSDLFKLQGAKREFLNFKGQSGKDPKVQAV